MSTWCSVVAVTAMASALPAAAQDRAASSQPAPRFQIADHAFLLDGRPLQILAGEIHPARIPREYWADRLRKLHCMGLNTASVYIFWNWHEPQPGHFRFEGDFDVAEFVRLAQREGLHVLLRPGPYVCAEWDFGGFPWWLLKEPGIKVRSSDPRFLRAAERYLKRLGQELAPLQVTRGGPILMVQVENEYGSFGNDKDYVAAIRDMIRAAGFDVPLYSADGPSQMPNAALPDVYPAVNGPGDQAVIDAIDRYRPGGPYLVAEFYPGWLDHWGEPHAKVDVAKLVPKYEWMLGRGISVCWYMFHGGTNFGFTSGANFGGAFQPQPTSYDYDAPLDEAGRPTPKFFALRDAALRHLPPGTRLPELPDHPQITQIPQIELTQTLPLFDALPPPRTAERPLTMEQLDVPHGFVLYRTRLAGPARGKLKLDELRDYAIVFANEKRLGVLDRRRNQRTLPIDVDEPNVTLDLLVENGGHINFGAELVDDAKGITQRVTLAGREILGWEMFPLPLDDPGKWTFPPTAGAAGAQSAPAGATGVTRAETAAVAPALHRNTFELERVGDTFLDMRGWGKGCVWVNGRNLGRFWSIGPQQTLYLPGVWLRRGRNEIIVLELHPHAKRTVAGLDTPILDQVNEAPLAPPPRPLSAAPRLDAADLVFEGSLGRDDWQTQRFPPRRARYLCLETLWSHAGDPFASVAELRLLDEAGRPLPTDDWKVLFVDSEESRAEWGVAENAFDDDPRTIWHTRWSSDPPPHPHTLLIDTGAAATVSGFQYLPRIGNKPAKTKDVRVYVRESEFESAR